MIEVMSTISLIAMRTSLRNNRLYKKTNVGDKIVRLDCVRIRDAVTICYRYADRDRQIDTAFET